MIFTMYEQPKILPMGLAKELDLIDDLPDPVDWVGPFKSVSKDPDGFMGIQAYWEINDLYDNAIAYIFCREAAVDMVRSLNARHRRLAADSDPVVVKFVQP